MCEVKGVRELCVSKLCVCKLCVGKLCVGKGAGGGGGGREYTTKNKSPTQRCLELRTK